MRHETLALETAWSQTLAYPPSCLRITVEIHQETGVDVYYWGLDVSDPHTGTLLAKIVRPTEMPVATSPFSEQMTADITALLRDILDPDPFPPTGASAGAASPPGSERSGS